MESAAIVALAVLTTLTALVAHAFVSYWISIQGNCFFINDALFINLMVSTYCMLSLNYFFTLIGNASDFPALAMLMRYRLRRTQKL
jgi:hypothetical protein